MFNLLATIAQFRPDMRIDRIGIFFFLATFAVGMCSFFLGHNHFASFFVTLSLFMLYFYRDPARVIPRKDGIVASPAEGMIKLIEFNVPAYTSEVDGASSNNLFTKISIQLDIFDIHVNRVPAKNVRITDARRFNTSFTGVATKEDAMSFIGDSKNSYHIFYEVDTKKDGLKGKKDCIVVVMMTGLIARRIVCRVNKGDRLNMGERVGIICFGSECDIYIPSSYKICVGKGQKVVGGETIIALSNEKVSIYDDVEYIVC